MQVSIPDRTESGAILMPDSGFNEVKRQIRSSERLRRAEEYNLQAEKKTLCDPPWSGRKFYIYRPPHAPRVCDNLLPDRLCDVYETALITVPATCCDT